MANFSRCANDVMYVACARSFTRLFLREFFSDGRRWWMMVCDWNCGRISRRFTAAWSVYRRLTKSMLSVFDIIYAKIWILAVYEDYTASQVFFKLHRFKNVLVTSFTSVAASLVTCLTVLFSCCILRNVLVKNKLQCWWLTTIMKKLKQWYVPSCWKKRREQLYSSWTD